MPDDTQLVNDVGSAKRCVALLIQNAVLLGYSPLEVAQQRESDPEVLGKAMVTGGSIHTDAQYLNVVCVVMCDISLIRP